MLPRRITSTSIFCRRIPIKKVIAEGGKPFKTRYWTDGDVLFSRQESTTANPKAVSVAYYPQTKNDKAYRLPDIPEGYYYNIIKQFNLNTYIEELYVPARATVWAGMTENHIVRLISEPYICRKAIRCHNRILTILRDTELTSTIITDTETELFNVSELSNYIDEYLKTEYTLKAHLRILCSRVFICIKK